MTRGRSLRLGVLLVVVAALAFGGYKLLGTTSGVLSADTPLVPTARVVRGALDLTVFANGDLRASKTMVITAPAVGGNLRLLQMAETGTPVVAGDVIMEFDPVEQQYLLEQSRLDMAEAEQSIVKMRADTEVQASQDQVGLLSARFDVRRAEMDATPMQGLIGANEFKRNQLSLEEARRRLTQVEDDVKSRALTTKAALAVVEERRAKVKFSADRAQANIDSLKVKAPMEGLVVARANRDGGMGMGMEFGMSAPEYRAGDNVFPGRPLADIFDITQMEIRSRVNEQERANLAVGQAATVLSDALPGASLSAKIATIAGLAARSNESMTPLREFDMTLKLDQADGRVRPGTSVRLVVHGTRVENALHVPRQAVFEKNGKSIVYVRVGDRFEAREVKAVHRTESRAVIEGLTEGAEVALINPENAAKTSPTKPAAAVAPQGPK